MSDLSTPQHQPEHQPEHQPQGHLQDGERLRELVALAPFAPRQCSQLVNQIPWESRLAHQHARATLERVCPRIEAVPGRVFAPVALDGLPASTLSVSSLAVEFRWGEVPPDFVPLPASDAANVHQWVEAWVGGRSDRQVDTLSHSPLPPRVSLYGRSWTLAAGLALVVQWLGDAARPMLATGVIEISTRPGTVRAASRLDTKRRSQIDLPGSVWCAPRDHADLRHQLDTWLGADWRAALHFAAHLAPAALAERALDSWRQGDRDRGEQQARAALDAGISGTERARALWVLGANQLQRGDFLSGRETLEVAESLFATCREEPCDQGETAPSDGPPIPPIFSRPRPYETERLWAQLGIGWLDAGHPARAVEILSHASAQLRQVETRIRDRAWGQAWLEAQGSLHRALISAGRLEQSEAALRQSLQLAGLPAERARTLGDWAEVARRARRFEDASRLLQQARAELAYVTSSTWRTTTRRYIELWRARLAHDLGQDAQLAADGAAPDWGRFPQPAILLENLFLDASELARHVDRYYQELPWGAQALALGVCCRAPDRTDALRRQTRHLAATMWKTTEDGVARQALDRVRQDAPDSHEAWARLAPY